MLQTPLPAGSGLPGMGQAEQNRAPGKGSGVLGGFGAELG